MRKDKSLESFNNRKSLFLCIGLSFLMVLMNSTVLGQNRRNKEVYTNLKKALKKPDQVKVLDLRGKNLQSIPKDIKEFENLEILLLSGRIKSLIFCPRSWKYLLGIRKLPAGGLAHINGRGGGNFYRWNEIRSLPEEIFSLKKLRLVDLESNPIKREGTQQLKEILPDLIILGRGYGKDWDKYSKIRDQAEEIAAEYGVDFYLEAKWIQ